MSPQISPDENIFMIKKELEACEVECRETKNIVRALENYRDIEARLKREIRARKKAESKADANAKAAQAHATRLKQAEAEVALLRSACADLRATCEQREPISRIRSDGGVARSPVPHDATLYLQACRSLGGAFPTPRIGREWSAPRTRGPRDGSSRDDDGREEPPFGDRGLGSALARWWSSPAASKDDDNWSNTALAKWWSPPTPAGASRTPEETWTYDDSGEAVWQATIQYQTVVQEEADPQPPAPPPQEAAPKCESGVEKTVKKDPSPRGRCDASARTTVQKNTDPTPCGSFGPNKAGAATASDILTEYIEDTKEAGTDHEGADTAMLKEYFSTHRCQVSHPTGASTAPPASTTISAPACALHTDSPASPFETILEDLTAKVAKLERSQHSFDAKSKKKKPVKLFRARKRSAGAKEK